VPTYQWLFNDSRHQRGHDSSTLALNNVQSASAGYYSVSVTNSTRSMTSNVAMLTVNSSGADRRALAEVAEEAGAAGARACVLQRPAVPGRSAPGLRRRTSPVSQRKVRCIEACEKQARPPSDEPSSSRFPPRALKSSTLCGGQPCGILLRHSIEHWDFSRTPPTPPTG